MEKISLVSLGASDSVKYPWAMVPPNGVSFARSGSTWIHWWSPVTSAKASMSFWVTSCHSLAPRSWPSYFLSSSIPVMVVMRYRLPGVPGPLLVADAPHLLYRAFYALPDSITGPDGGPVNALLGSVNALLQVVEERSPRAVVLCFGAEAADYRTEAYPAYHAHRPAMPDGLASQWAKARGFYEAFGWTVLDHDGLEADDLLHSLALAEERAGGDALIFTGDRDLFQCVTEHVKVLLQQARAGFTEMGPEEVRARYGIGPQLVPDFIALRGDPSDGLPGAKGIGEKTAADILQRKGDLEHAILGAIREKPSVRRALIEQAAELRSFKEIATLVEVEMNPVPDAPTDFECGAKAAEALGMRRLAERLKQWGEAA